MDCPGMDCCPARLTLASSRSDGPEFLMGGCGCRATYGPPGKLQVHKGCPGGVLQRAVIPCFWVFLQNAGVSVVTRSRGLAAHVSLLYFCKPCSECWGFQVKRPRDRAAGVLLSGQKLLEVGSPPVTQNMGYGSKPPLGSLGDWFQDPTDIQIWCK